MSQREAFLFFADMVFIGGMMYLLIVCWPKSKP